MNKSDLVDIVGKRSHMPKSAASEAIDVLFEEIMRALSKGEKIVISGFGTFSLGKVKDKEVVPFGKNDKRTIIKGHKVVNFKVGKPLKKLVW